MTTPIGKVFVSHASADKAFVDRLVSDLEARAVPMWYGEEKVSGLVSGEFCSDQIPRHEGRNVQRKRAGLITP
jgi:hypothetical protein